VIENPAQRRSLAASAREAARQLPAWQDSAKLFSHVLEAVA
jgi:hypothetical protein